MDNEQENELRIPDFYKDKSILITGATGFIGKVLVEKLLRSCKELRTIFLLLRCKNGVTPEETLAELLKAKIFEKVKTKNPSSLSKLVAVDGNLVVQNLGLSNSDEETLILNVSVVFHAAGDDNLTQTLKQSFDINTLGTQRIIELCRKMQHLQALVYVSSAYCHGNKHQVEEIVYDSPAKPEKIVESLESVSKDMIKEFEHNFTYGLPNAYSYTITLTEALLKNVADSLPVCIIRPSTVTAAWKEPYSGWIDSQNSFTRLYMSASRGFLRSVHYNPASTADFIPVDIVVNTIISSAWYISRYSSKNLMVVNCTTGNINRITWGRLKDLITPLFFRYPTLDTIHYPSDVFTHSKFWNSLLVFTYHYIPAYLKDFFALATGRNRKMVSRYNELQRDLSNFMKFTTRDCKFSCENLIRLSQSLSESDKRIFNLDIQNLHWKTYMEDFIVGIHRYLIKDDLSSVQVARRRLKWLYVSHKLLQILIVIFMWKVVIKRYVNIRKLRFKFIIFMINVYSNLPIEKLRW